MILPTPQGKAEHRRGRNRPAMLRRGPSPRSLNINPSFVHSTPLLYLTSKGNKAEPTARNNTQTSYLFVLRHGGSGEPALQVEKRRISHKGKIRSIQCCSVSKRIGAATKVSHALTRISSRLKPKRRKRSQDSSRGL